MIRVYSYEVLPLFGRVVLRKDRLHRARWLASSAIDAFIRVDIQHLRGLKICFVLTRVNAVNRTNVNACSILRAYAGFRNYICHVLSKFLLFEAGPQIELLRIGTRLISPIFEKESMPNSQRVMIFYGSFGHGLNIEERVYFSRREAIISDYLKTNHIEHLGHHGIDFARHYG